MIIHRNFSIYIAVLVHGKSSYKKLIYPVQSRFHENLLFLKKRR